MGDLFFSQDTFIVNWIQLALNFFLLLCCRKKRESYYGEKFILDNVKVDKHLANLYKNANQPVRHFISQYSIFMLFNYM